MVLCLNPDDIPQNLNITTEPALARRFIVLHYQTRFVSPVKFEELPLEDQTSGFYAIADDALIEKFKTDAYLQALTWLLLTEGRKEFLERKEKGEDLFPSDLDALTSFFKQDHDDFVEWWSTNAIKDPAGILSIQAVADRYNQDHLGQPRLIPKKALGLIRMLHPTPSHGRRTVPGRGKVECVLGYALKPQAPIPSSSTPSSTPSSSSFSFPSIEEFDQMMK